MPTQEFNEIWRLLRELACRQEKTEEEIRKTEEEIKKVNKMVGDLVSEWGKFVEGLVEPSTLELAKKLDIEIEGVYRRVEAFKDKEKVEIDILIEGKKDNRDVVLVVEAKSHFESDDMENFLWIFLRFFKFFSRYKDSEVMGVVASPRFGDGVITYAQRQGFFVLIPSGNIMDVLYPPKPKVLIYNEKENCF